MKIPEIIMNMAKWKNLAVFIKNSNYDFTIPDKPSFKENYKLAKEPKIKVKTWQTIVD